MDFSLVLPVVAAWWFIAVVAIALAALLIGSAVQPALIVGAPVQTAKICFHLLT